MVEYDIVAHTEPIHLLSTVGSVRILRDFPDSVTEGQNTTLPPIVQVLGKITLIQFDRL